MSLGAGPALHFPRGNRPSTPALRARRPGEPEPVFGARAGSWMLKAGSSSVGVEAAMGAFKVWFGVALALAGFAALPHHSEGERAVPFFPPGVCVYV